MNTTAQAVRQWCPMVRLPLEIAVMVRQPDGSQTVSSVASTVAAGHNSGPNARCAADMCAMWRWTDPAIEKGYPVTWWPEEDEPLVEPPRPEVVPASAEWIPMTRDGDEVGGGYWQQSQSEVDREFEQALAARRGYCGLAGRPEVTAC